MLLYFLFHICISLFHFACVSCFYRLSCRFRLLQLCQYSFKNCSKYSLTIIYRCQFCWLVHLLRIRRISCPFSLLISITVVNLINNKMNTYVQKRNKSTYADFVLLSHYIVRFSTSNCLA